MSEKYLILAIIVATFATFLTRYLPFLMFDKKTKPSQTLVLFERFMPLMIMVILVFYCIKDVKFVEFPYGIFEIIGILSAVFLHVKFKNILLSIFSATAIYMLLVQVLEPSLRGFFE
ncbi:MAG: branched-chain amino acid transporter permease [Campylobacteraceae bacterium]